LNQSCKTYIFAIVQVHYRNNKGIVSSARRKRKREGTTDLVSRRHKGPWKRPFSDKTRLDDAIKEIKGDYQLYPRPSLSRGVRDAAVCLYHRVEKKARKREKEKAGERKQEKKKQTSPR